MAHEFKVGDLALVVGGELFLGQQVEINEWIEPGGLIFDRGDKKFFLAGSEGKGGWAVHDGKQMGVKFENQLMPLRGDFEPEQQKTKEAEPCA